MQRNLVQELKEILPNKVDCSFDELKKHGGNQFYLSKNLPDVVCYAENEEDIIKLIDFCIVNKVPIIPYGSGTSVEGQIAAIHGGISLDLSKMNRIKEFNPADGYVIVEAGLPYNKLNEFLEPNGYHFPVEAGWGASVGGMAATNASGAGATDAGSMSKNILGCSAVVYKNNHACKITSGSKSAKTSAGYNLTSLFVGSEGTLGVFTDLTLKIRRNFSLHKTICAQFNEIQEAINFVITMKGRVHFRRAELLDKLQTEACVKYSKVNYLYQNLNTVIIELSGNTLSVKEEQSIIVDFLNKTNAECVRVFDDKKSSEGIWMMRKHACPAAIDHLDKQKKAMATDISVPLSKLSDCIDACYSHMNRLGIKAPLVAHIGDGNFHFTIIIDPENQFELERAREFNRCIVGEALKVGGTCTGEHGIGIGKKTYLEMEHPDSLFLMARIKEAFDPLNIFNPGKIFDLRSKLCMIEKHENIDCNNESKKKLLARL